jgi:hypothetical protein
MPSPKTTYDLSSGATRLVVNEEHIEYGFIGKLQNLKYDYRSDIGDRAALERNFREKFEALNRVKLTDGEFTRLLDEIVTPDVFTAARTLRSINAFTREDGTPLNYTLVNIKDWCKNTFEVVNQLRINTDKRQNQMTDEHIAKIIKTYQFREQESRYSRRVEMTEIEKNDFNLNISRYISTAVGEAEIDLATTHAELVKIEKDIAAAKQKHNAFLKELGLSPLP